MSAENNLYLFEKCKVFIDQNLPSQVAVELRKKGYKNVATVYDFNWKGINDGKLLVRIKDRKYILATMDYHFHKQASKYNNEMSILITKTLSGTNYSARNMATQINNELIHRYKEIRSYYE